ncbi:MAG TPA: triose-phosphate isomerase [Phycisphaerae bacterium]|nr:triose-phosphate isomerase [Phycisphaerae bacterium]HRR84072.1 triose-phosphate isomerase [Phycisphaerae bacterium]
MRRKFVAGNWKMNLNVAKAKALVEGLKAKIPASVPVDLAVFPPFTMLSAVGEALKGSAIKLGAQNCYFEPEGAFTGEVAPGMLVDVGCELVLIGHSERRHILGETNAMLKKKIVAALAAGLKVIYCVGEKLDEREAGGTEAVLYQQIHEVLGPDVDLANVVIAYEPVWAIGTGRTATPDQAQEAHAYIRREIGKLYNSQAAQTLRIQYGGSVKASNAKELMNQPDVDGALVGGASLKVDEFVGIIEGAAAAR